MSQTATYDRLHSLAKQVLECTGIKPRAAILLGTGLGALADRIEVTERIAYRELDGMPMTTAESHAGEVVFGHLGGVPVVAFSGRLHCYEGHSIEDVVVPVRLARFLGVSNLIMGSAVGGLSPDYKLGSIVALEDHLNLMGVNPLVGPNDDRIGSRWPDMYEVYSKDYREVALQVASEQGVDIHEGVYAAVLGPNLETPAEYRMLRNMGADVVGMSTVPEAIAAVHCGMKTLAFAIVTDLCTPEALEPVDIARIIEVAGEAEPVLAELIIGSIRELFGDE